MDSLLQHGGLCMGSFPDSQMQPFEVHVGLQWPLFSSPLPSLCTHSPPHAQHMPSQLRGGSQGWPSGVVCAHLAHRKRDRHTGRGHLASELCLRAMSWRHSSTQTCVHALRLMQVKQKEVYGRSYPICSL